MQITVQRTRIDEDAESTARRLADTLQEWVWRTFYVFPAIPGDGHSHVPPDTRKSLVYVVTDMWGARSDAIYVAAVPDPETRIMHEVPSEHIHAPFTPGQVGALNRWQSRPGVHPFTCGSDGCGAVLIAYPSGWECPRCGYTQNWAHSFMARG